jgi:UDP-N-acetylglucosamine 4,6-dehydratase
MFAANRILITGGTGTFGRAFTRVALAWKHHPHICILSRGEHAQDQMRREFGEDDQRLHWFIGDVRDRDRLRRAMHNVDLVIHAAALKRIEVGHYNPIEMVRTNIEGAINVIEAAIDVGVDRVIALSSDKAYQPVSAYGYSKAMAECLFQAAYHSDTLFAVTRYGNIAGSAGSVIPKWRELLKDGIPTVPCTDPDCTRFWMTINQAVEVVVRTAYNMSGGELVVPELPAYRLGDLAEAMGAEPVFVGLPAWEKKHESMGDGKSSDQTRRMTVDELKEALQHV